MTPRSDEHRVLITGAAGQDGYYLSRQLVARGARVFALVRDTAAGVADGVELVEGDMRDGSSLRRAIDTAEPREIYNLAATTFVPLSRDRDEAVEDVNATGVDRLAAAMRQCGARIRLCHASSAEIFGEAPGRRLAENQPLDPVTPYGAAKAKAHRAIVELREQHGWFACSAILFNHESPRRPASFVTRKITMAAARISRGIEEYVTLGNLDAARDWGYAPEYMDAMRRMAESDLPRDYVVATGRSATVRDFARLAFARVGLDWERHVRSDAALLRPADVSSRIGDASRIERELGWKAATTLEELVAIMVDADLALLDAAPAGRVPAGT